MFSPATNVEPVVGTVNVTCGALGAGVGVGVGVGVGLGVGVGAAPPK